MTQKRLGNTDGRNQTRNIFYTFTQPACKDVRPLHHKIKPATETSDSNFSFHQTRLFATISTCRRAQQGTISRGSVFQRPAHPRRLWCHLPRPLSLQDLSTCRMPPSQGFVRRHRAWAQDTTFLPTMTDRMNAFQEPSLKGSSANKNR